MKGDRDDGRYHRYLLGAASDAEREGVERACFERADGMDALSAAEDDLIEDYLSGRLDREERGRFERHYLSSPGHRTRVAVMRAIASAQAATPPMDRRTSRFLWWAAGVAAAVIVVVMGVAWNIRSRAQPVGVPSETTAAPTSRSAGGPQVGAGSAPRDPAPDPRPGGPDPPPAEPTVIALAISPILVRGADEPATIAIARGTDVVRLVLLGEPGEHDAGGRRVIVRTMAGRQIWRGRTRRAASTAGREPARVDIPAALLLPDDYIVIVLGTDSGGTEHERYRYFFSVRVP